MNISPVTTPAVFPVGLPELVNPSAAAIGILAQPAVVGASLVDLSRLGQLLSASAMLQPQPRSQAAAAVDAVGEQGASVNLDDGFGKLLAAAQLFVGAYNQFQSADVNNAQDPLLAPFENVLSLAINALPGVDSGTSLLSSLQQVGIGFQQDASNTTGSAPLTVDTTALQSAFNANPTGTTALLAQAFQTIGVLAVQLAGQNADLFVTGADVALPASPFDVFPAALPPIPVDAAVPGALADQAAVAANIGPAPAPAPSPVLPAGAPAVSDLPTPAVATTQAAPVETANASPANSALSLDPALAPDAALSPISAALPAAVAVDAQTAASSASSANANANAAASPFGGAPNLSPNVLPNVVPDLTPTALPVAALNAADAALQSVLADQALRDALDANLVLPPTPEAVAPAADTVAPANPPLIAAQAGAEQSGEPSAPDQLANPIAIPVATPIANAAASVAQAPAPLATLDDGRAPQALDPSIAAAVAAYRLGDGALGLSANQSAARLSEPDTDISAIDTIRPVDLDPQDGSSNARRNETARNAVLALEKNKALAPTRLPAQQSVDITV